MFGNTFEENKLQVNFQAVIFFFEFKFVRYLLIFNCRHGILGVDRLFNFLLQEWLQDIKKKQLPKILGGVGPMYSLVQLC